MKHLVIVGLCLVLICAFGAVAHSQEIQMGTFSLSPSNEGFSLKDGSGERVVLFEVTFPKSFEVKPDVILNLNTIDADKSENLRITMKPASISRDGFTIQVKPWAESKINLVGGTWLAVSHKK